jgi:hypothetical protein
VDLDELDVADYVVGGSAFVFLVSMFLPWYGGGAYSDSGWSYFLSGMIPLLLAVLMVCQIVLSKLVDVELPDLPWGFVHLGAGIACAVIVILRLLIASDNVGGVDIDIQLDRKFGLFIAVLAAIGLAIGGFLKFMELGGAGAAGGSSSGGTPTQF